MADGRNRPNRPIRPRQGPGGRKRRVVIEGGGARSREGRQPRDRSAAGPPRQQQPVAPPTGPVTVESGVTVKDLSQALGVPMGELIKILMNLGQMRTATQSLSDEEVELIAGELGREVTIKHAAEEELEPAVYEDAEADLVPRPPVVTIMGHVDHGKTTLLDAIRQASVVETEAGGVTQLVVAVNKVDVPDSNPDRVRSELAAEGLQPEEWGGTTQFSEVSAKQKTNLEDLLERILLVADAELDLRANAGAEASGYVVESRLDVGRGPVATILVNRGTLKVGDA